MSDKLVRLPNGDWVDPAAVLAVQYYEPTRVLDSNERHRVCITCMAADGLGERRAFIINVGFESSADARRFMDDFARLVNERATAKE